MVLFIAFVSQRRNFGQNSKLTREILKLLCTFACVYNVSRRKSVVTILNLLGDFLVYFAHTHIFLASKSIFKTNDENSKAICENYSKLRINPSC